MFFRSPCLALSAIAARRAGGSALPMPGTMVAPSLIAPTAFSGVVSFFLYSLKYPFITIVPLSQKPATSSILSLLPGPCLSHYQNVAFLGIKAVVDVIHQLSHQIHAQPTDSPFIQVCRQVR